MLMYAKLYNNQTRDQWQRVFNGAITPNLRILVELVISTYRCYQVAACTRMSF